MILRIGRMNSRRKIHKRNFSFTIVELLLVVIIMAVILALAVPNFKNSFSRIVLQQTVNQISYVMRYAQSRAIQNNVQQRLIFDPERKEFGLKEEVISPETEDKKKFAAIKGRWGRIFSIPERLNIELAQNEINFFPDGKMDRVRIYLCQKEDCMTVSTKEQAGYVDVYEGRIE